jgi:hypothetical protein
MRKLRKIAPLVVLAILVLAVTASATGDIDWCREWANNPDSLGLQWGCYLQTLLGW